MYEQYEAFDELEDGLSFIKQKLIESGMISADKIVMEDVLGLEIYNVKSSMDEIHFVAQDFEITYKTDFTLNRMDYRFWSEKLDVALSFLNTSILINDVRIKFLLKILPPAIPHVAVEDIPANNKANHKRDGRMGRKTDANLFVL